MTPEDFHTIKLGSDFYYGWQKYKLIAKAVTDENNMFSAEVYLAGGTLCPAMMGRWNDYCANFSLEPIDHTKRFYQWLICQLGEWEIPTAFLDEHGIKTTGIKEYYNGVWEDYAKQKTGRWIDIAPDGSIVNSGGI